jgi:hypothetical protein
MQEEMDATNSGKELIKDAKVIIFSLATPVF